MSELAPKGTNPKMTKAQVKAYVQKMKTAQAIAQAKLDAAKNSGDAELEKLELEYLEEKLDSL